MTVMRNVLMFGAVSVIVLSANAENPPPRIPAYGVVMQGNVAAEFTTSDYMTRPHLIGDNQFIAGYALSGFSTGSAACSFKAGSVNLFGAYRRAAATNHEIRLGIGMGNVFGAGIIYDIDRTLTDNETTETKRREPIDGFGGFGSVNAGPINFFGDVRVYISPAAYINSDSPTTDTYSLDRQIAATLGVMKDSRGERDMAVGGDFDFGYNKQKGETSIVTVTTTEDNTTLYLGGDFYFGIPLFKNRSYSVYTGMAVGAFYNKFSDDLTGAAIKSVSTVSGAFTPNIAFQKTLGKGFEIMAGGSVNLLHVTRSVSESNLNVETKTVSAQTDDGQFSLGLRWKRGNFAIEGQLSATTLTNGPYFISGTPGTSMFGSLGVSLGFGGRPSRMKQKAGKARFEEAKEAEMEEAEQTDEPQEDETEVEIETEPAATPEPSIDF